MTKFDNIYDLFNYIKKTPFFSCFTQLTSISDGRLSVYYDIADELPNMYKWYYEIHEVHNKEKCLSDISEGSVNLDFEDLQRFAFYVIQFKNYEAPGFERTFANQYNDKSLLNFDYEDTPCIVCRHGGDPYNLLVIIDRGVFVVHV